MSSFKRQKDKRCIHCLQAIILAHLSVVFFQVPIRAILLDTTFLRDIFLAIGTALWLVLVLGRMIRTKCGFVEMAVFGYLCYGVIMCSRAVAIGVMTPLGAGVNFRNNFAPTILVVVAKAAFASPKSQNRLINYIFLLFFLLVVETAIENALYYTGLWNLVPWYDFVFKTNYRFIGNLVNSPGDILPSKTPFLGMFGWRHDTAAVLMASFALFVPFLFAPDRYNRQRRAPIGLLARLGRVRYLLAILAIAEVALLFVKTQYIALAVVLLIVPAFFMGASLLRTSVITLVFLVTLMTSSAFLERVQQDVEIGFLGTQESESTLQIIFRESGLRSISQYSWDRMLLGSGDADVSYNDSGEEFEVRLLLFTGAYGFLWLAIVVTITGVVAGMAFRSMRNTGAPFLHRQWACGVFGVICVYTIDSLHYARIMYAPNIDLASVCIGLFLSTRASDRQFTHCFRCAPPSRHMDS